MRFKFRLNLAILAQGNGLSRAPAALGGRQSFALGHARGSLLARQGGGGWLRALARSVYSPRLPSLLRSPDHVPDGDSALCLAFSPLLARHLSRGWRPSSCTPPS